MATDLRTERDLPETPRDVSLAQLVTGIISDIQDLMKQQFALFRHEVEHDFSRSKQAALTLAAGAGVIFIAVWLLILMLVHLLWWATDLPLWASYGIVGGTCAFGGGLLLYLGIRKFQSFNPLPDESAQALKENVQCLLNPK